MEASILNQPDLKRKRTITPDADESDMSCKQHFGNTSWDKETFVESLGRYSSPAKNWELRDDQLLRLEEKTAAWIRAKMSTNGDILAEQNNISWSEIDTVLNHISTIDRLQPDHERLTAIRANVASVCWKYKIAFALPRLLTMAVHSVNKAVLSGITEHRLVGYRRIDKLRRTLESLGKECAFVDHAWRQLVMGFMRQVELELFLEPRRSVMKAILEGPTGVDRTMHDLVSNFSHISIHPLLVAGQEFRLEESDVVEMADAF